MLRVVLQVQMSLGHTTMNAKKTHSVGCFLKEIDCILSLASSYQRFNSCYAHNKNRPHAPGTKFISLVNIARAL